MKLIEKNHLESWAGTYEAKGLFPAIVKSLICEVVSPSELQMPSRSGVWLPGLDGEVVNHEKNRFVPSGVSVWELGTEPNPKKKAQSDYDKRKKRMPKGGKRGKTQSQLVGPKSTFVFVTPRFFKDKRKWAAERKKKDHIWKDVKVIDVRDLLDWLELAPATYLQLAYKLNILPEKGLESPDQAWEEWSYLTKPPTSEELVIVGREQQKKQVIERLIGPPSTFVVRAESSREALGFALAVMRQHSPEAEQFSLHARTIVAEDDKVAVNLGNRENLKNHIIVLKQALGQVSGVLSSNGCHVIVPVGNDALQGDDHIVLMRPIYPEFSAALVRMGVKYDEAMRVGLECGSSIVILQRLHPFANAEPPPWVSDAKIVHLLPAMLAGRWNDNCQADREILCQLAGVPDYETVKNQLKDFLRVGEPPLQKVGEVWTLTSHLDVFQLIAWRLSTADLDRFKNVFQTVYVRIDPKVEIPLDEWIYQDIKGELGHSAWLKIGLAETILLISQRGLNAQLNCVASPESYANQVVAGLPGLSNDWRILASIRDQIPRLMEAAPSPFLDSLEHLLEANPNDVRRLFAEGQMGFASPMQTGLLWGLEILAWNPRHLPRVALILSKLASIDPGGRWMNRPINSLVDVFSWSHPGTTATNDQRVAAIDLILDRLPDVGWSLLVKLIPGGSIGTTGTMRPRWRDIGELPEESRTRQGQVKYASAIVDRTLNFLGSYPDRWRTLLPMFGALNSSQQEKAIALLTTIADGPTSLEVKIAFWHLVRDFVSEHRTYHEAPWAVYQRLLDLLEPILAKLAPTDPIERNRWLFDDWLPGLPTGENDINLRQKRVEELRQQAVREILNAQRVEGLVALGTACKYPGFVASVAVPLLADMTEVYTFLQLAIAAGEKGLLLASQISGDARVRYGDAWRDQIYKQAKVEPWSPTVVGSLLVWWPDQKQTWDDAEALGAETEYWLRKPMPRFQGPPDEQAFQIDRLIDVGRATQIFTQAAYLGNQVPTNALVRLFGATLKELSQMRTVEEIQSSGLSSHYVREFLNELRSRSDLPRDELARREYSALPILGPLDAQGLTLHEFMASNPRFFVEVLRDVYRPAHRDKEQDTDVSAEAQFRGRNGYTLLQGMKQIPGQMAGNQINEEALFEWINSVRTNAAEMDRAEVADIHIGQILAHASQDPEDHAWPHQTVRNVIEKLASEGIERGLAIERFNMRGTFSKELYEGGAQERELASQYHGWAKVSRARWPRMAQVLDIIAQNWEDHARFEDTRAEQDKLEH